MTRVDTTPPGHGAQQAGAASASVTDDSGRRFARCVARAADRSSCDAEAPGSVSGASVPLHPRAACLLHGEGSAEALSTMEDHTSKRLLTDDPGLAAGAPLDAAQRTAAGERAAPDDPVTAPVDAARAQAAAPCAAAAAPTATISPNADAAALAQSLLARLPPPGLQDRSVTLSFAAGGGAVDQIVLSVSGGLVSIVVTARAQARERVAAALPELARLLRERGVRVAALGLG